MTLKEAIDTLRGWRDEIESGAIHVTSTVKPHALEAFRLVIEAAAKQAEADAAVPVVTLTEAK